MGSDWESLQMGAGPGAGPGRLSSNEEAAGRGHGAWPSLVYCPVGALLLVPADGGVAYASLLSYGERPVDPGGWRRAGGVAAGGATVIEALLLGP